VPQSPGCCCRKIRSLRYQGGSPDLASALAFALRYNGRKRVHTGDEMMARITAERLIAHLEQAGFV
jgi:hypothetical protein